MNSSTLGNELINICGNAPIGTAVKCKVKNTKNIDNITQSLATRYAFLQKHVLSVSTLCFHIFYTKTILLSVPANLNGFLAYVKKTKIIFDTLPGL